MKFNLVKYRSISVPSGPYKQLTEAQLGLFVDGDTGVSGIEILAGETLSIRCDLGARYLMGILTYYRTAASVENLMFFGRQGEGAEFPLIEVPHQVLGDEVIIDFSSLNDRYEFIHVIHTVLVGSAMVYELQILSNDDNILFGTKGEATVFSVDSGTATLLPERVTIYNPAPIELDFYCLLDAEDVDSIGMQLGTSSSGIFSSLYTSGICLPDDFAWSAGSFDSTIEDSGSVILSPGTTSGTYYTPVLDISSLQGRRLFWQATLTGTSQIDDFTSLDSVPIIGVRFSNEAPTDGGWVSGQVSSDSNWSLSSGAINFQPYDNNNILNPQYANYFQARLEFHTTVSGETPLLERVGIEEGFKVTISGNNYSDIYVKSTYTNHIFGRTSNLVVWFLETRNEEQ